MPDNKWMLFNDGEGILQTDFNDMQSFFLSKIYDQFKFFQALAITAPRVGAADWDFDEVSGGEFTTPTYLDDFCWAIGGSGRANKPIGTLVSSFGPGMIGLYSSSGPPVVGPEFPRFRWVQIDGETFTHSSNAGGGSSRFDVVHVGIAAPADGDSESRDFKDAVTGALSTTTPNKRRTWVGDAVLLEGTVGGGLPTVPAGRVALYYVELTAGGVELQDIWDWRVPVGSVSVAQAFSGQDSYDNFTGAVAGAGSRPSGAAGEKMVLMPKGGNNGLRFARLVGMEVKYQLSAGAIVTLGNANVGGGAAPAVLGDDITSLFTLDGTARFGQFDTLNASPFFGGPGGGSPFSTWNNHSKHTGRVPTTVISAGIQMGVTSGAAGDFVDHLKFFFAHS